MPNDYLALKGRTEKHPLESIVGASLRKGTVLADWPKSTYSSLDIYVRTDTTLVAVQQSDLGDVTMFHRKHQNKRKSNSAFKRRVSRTDRLNLANPRRGGIRL